MDTINRKAIIEIILSNSVKKDLMNFEHRWKLKDWIDEEILLKCNSFQKLVLNPNSMFTIECLLKSEKFNINWGLLSTNPSAIYILEKNQNKISWMSLCRNPSALYLIEKNQNNIVNNEMCLFVNTETRRIIENNLNLLNHEASYLIQRHESCFDLIDTTNIDNLNWHFFSLNTHPLAIKMMEENINKINWISLNQNPKAVHILEKNQDKICWNYFVQNEGGIYLIERGIKDGINISWEYLSKNPMAIDLLEKNKDKIYVEKLLLNPNIYELDYEFFYERMNIFKKELIEKTWHPRRIMNWCLTIDEQKDLN